MQADQGVAVLPAHIVIQDGQVQVNDLPDAIAVEATDTQVRLIVSGEVAEPVRLVWLTEISIQLHVRVATNTMLTLIEERMVALQLQTTIDLAEQATLQHVIYQDAALDAELQLGSTMNLAADSRYHSVRLNLGGQHCVDQLTVNMNGKRSDCQLYGLALPQAQTIEHRVAVQHHVPHSTSGQVFHHLLGNDQSRTTFVGRAVVAKQAQQCVAKQVSHNVLLAPQAQATTAPELEIYADQVECAHGASVGALDQDALFYLRSRGLTLREAMHLLASAEAETVLAQINNFHAQTALTAIVQQRLNVLIQEVTPA